MTKRVVLAYSGGLDTSVAVRWIREEWGDEVDRVRGRRRPAQADGDEDTIRSARARRGRGRGRGHRRPRRVRRTTSSCPRCRPTRCTRASTRWCPRCRGPVIVEHLVASARRHGADAVGHGCTGKGNDQVRFEVSSRTLAPDLDVLAPGPGLGLHRAPTASTSPRSGTSRSRPRRRSCTRSTRTCGAARSSAACSRIRGRRAPEEPYTLTEQSADAPREPTRARRAASSRACPSSLDGEATAASSSSSARSAPLVGSYGWGRVDMVENRRVGIKSREVYECPASLALCSRTSDLEASRSSATSCARSSASRSASPSSIYDGLWHSPLMSAFDAFVDRHATARHRRGAAAARSRAVHAVGRRRRAASTTTTSRPTTPRTRSATRTPRASCGCGACRSRRGRAARARARRERRRAGETAPGVGKHALARALRRRPGRRAARVHRQPPVRPAARPRRPRGFARRTCTCSPASACSPSDERAVIDAALDRVERRARPTDVRVRPDRRRHPHRDRAPGHRDRRARPAPSSTPVGAATTRSPSTCGCSCAGRARRRSTRIHELQDVLLRRAEEAADVYLPGYTHLQRAQPVLLAHHLLAHFWALGPRRRPLARLRSSARRRLAARCGRARRVRACRSIPTSSPTSSGSRGAFENSLDAVSDRDFVAEALFVAALTQVHLSRLGEEIVLWSTRGVRLPAARRRVLHRFVDAAAEEEPRHRRARPRQGRPAHRPPHRLPRDAEGPAARVQPRPAGGQGAAVRRARHVRARRCSRWPGSSTTAEFVDDAHDGGGRRPDERGHRSRRAPRRARACRSARRTRSSAHSCASRSSAASRSTSSSSTEPHLGPDCLALLEPGRARAPPHDARAAPDPSRSRVSSTPPGTVSPTSRRGSTG